LEPDMTCGLLCRGNNKEFCGGSSVLNVYEAGTTKRTFGYDPS